MLDVVTGKPGAVKGPSDALINSYVHGVHNGGKKSLIFVRMREQFIRLLEETGGDLKAMARRMRLEKISAGTRSPGLSLAPSPISLMALAFL